MLVIYTLLPLIMSLLGEKSFGLVRNLQATKITNSGVSWVHFQLKCIPHYLSDTRSIYPINLLYT